MAYTTTDIESIDAAILELALGNRTTSITFSNGQTVAYAAARLDELKQLRGFIAAQVNKATSTRRSFIRMKATGKGL